MGRPTITGQVSTETQRTERLVKIAQMYLRGKSQLDIAHELGVTQQQVSLDLKKIRQQWRQEAVLDFSEMIERELSKIDHLEHTYWQQFEASKRDKERVTKTISQDGATPRVTELVQETHAVATGDTRFLEGVQWCIERRAALLGLDAPQRNVNLNATVDTSRNEAIANKLLADTKVRELVAAVRQRISD